MSYTAEQLKKMLLPELQKIAKALGLSYTKVKKADLIEKILNSQPDKKKDDDEELLSRAKSILKKYIKLGHETLSVNSSFKHLASQLTPDEYKKIENHKDALKKYVKERWEKYDSKQPVQKPKKENVKKYTVAQLKEHLKNIGVTETLRGKLKADFIRYSQSDRCYPEKGEVCKGENEVCDIRNNLCVLDEDIPSRKGIKKIEYNGYTVYGTEEQLSTISTDSGNSVDDLTDEMITDEMITFIKTYKEKLSNVKMIEHLKKTFSIKEGLKKIEEKFYPFLKTLYKDVKQSNIGYSCDNGICVLSRDKNKIKYSTVEECKLECKKTVEEQDYYACRENKCVVVPPEEGEYKTNEECREYCENEQGNPRQPEVEAEVDKKELPEDKRLMVLGEKGVDLKDMKELQPDKKKSRIIKVEIDDISGKKYIIHDYKKIPVREVKEVEKPKLVKEIDDILQTQILYDNEFDKHTLALMKCLGLLLA